ncbi:hypothetical protein [Vitiosangium sp. GDMCC 1.1324]|uniref:hypothetical protein n=1 Tax=Vitiosangium sp. (strain GDMCC 1.1324) TaxID=2138576 RepID=UPI000D34399B|nr:hypothetical protein [Vitiosangium sp. GDMCC 1.1324]PTL82112.1 hypothetical protein DAT35_20135 [Vitiosangium sp. GDMCC 1.1324]
MIKLNTLSLSSSAARARLAPTLPSIARNPPALPDASGLARMADAGGALGSVGLHRADAFEAGGLQGMRIGHPAAAVTDSFQPTAKPQGDAAEGSSIPKPTDKRPEGDTRSAADIVKDSPVLAKLGRQKDIKFDQLCKQTGVDPKLSLTDSRQNPDAVYRMSKVLEYIDGSKDASGGDRSKKVQNGQGDGNIEGITKSGDARHGTEAGLLKDFAEKGYGALKSDHQLDVTSDTHVKADGSNKDNFQWFAGEVGKKIWFIPGLSNVLTGIGNSEGGFLGAVKGGLGGVVKTWKGVAEGVFDALKFGRINPASMALGAYKGALGETEAAPEVVKDVVNMLP